MQKPQRKPECSCLSFTAASTRRKTAIKGLNAHVSAQSGHFIPDQRECVRGRKTDYI